MVGLFNHYLAKWRDRRRDQAAREYAAGAVKEAHKRDFRAAVNSLRDTVLAAKDSELIEAHKQSLPRFREECAKIEPEISDAADFRASRDAYLGLTGPDIECRDANEKPPPQGGVAGNARMLR